MNWIRLFPISILIGCTPPPDLDVGDPPRASAGILDTPQYCCMGVQQVTGELYECCRSGDNVYTVAGLCQWYWQFEKMLVMNTLDPLDDCQYGPADVGVDGAGGAGADLLSKRRYKCHHEVANCPPGSGPLEEHERTVGVDPESEDPVTVYTEWHVGWFDGVAPPSSVTCEETSWPWGEVGAESIMPKYRRYDCFEFTGSYEDPQDPTHFLEVWADPGSFLFPPFGIYAEWHFDQFGLYPGHGGMNAYCFDRGPAWPL